MKKTVNKFVALFTAPLHLTSTRSLRILTLASYENITTGGSYAIFTLFKKYVNSTEVKHIKDGYRS